jgi:hypothetical protein
MNVEGGGISAMGALDSRGAARRLMARPPMAARRQDGEAPDRAAMRTK